jgi:NAD(P)-dependent dehydrogenase (short-subunit alcohol dehydrogenase family)
LDLAAKATEALGGRVDILVNSAGVFPFGPTDSHDEATFDAVYSLNVKAPWFLVSADDPRGQQVGDSDRAHLDIISATRSTQREGGPPWPVTTSST